VIPRRPPQRRSLLKVLGALSGVAAVAVALVAFWLLHFIVRAWTFAIVVALLGYAAVRMWRTAKSHWETGSRGDP